MLSVCTIRAKLVAGWGAMLNRAVTSAICALMMTVSGAAERRALDVRASTITVRVSKAGMFSMFGDNHVVAAHAISGYVDDTAPHVEVVFDARGMRVLDPHLSDADRAEVQAKMIGPEVLDAQRFPEIRFRSTTVTPGGPDRWTVRGRLELHGRVREVVARVVREAGHYRGTSTFRQTDFGIKPVSVAAGAVKVKDELTIEFDFVLQ